MNCKQLAKRASDRYKLYVQMGLTYDKLEQVVMEQFRREQMEYENLYEAPTKETIN